MSQRIFESRSRMPQEGGCTPPTGMAALGGPPNRGPLTVHSIMTPADARAVERAAYPRNDWNDVVHVRSKGD